MNARTAAAAVALVAAALLGVTTSAAAPSAALPPVGHVFVIVLENEGYAATFGDPAADPYLAKTLPAKGVLLTTVLRDRPQAQRQLHRA